MLTSSINKATITATAALAVASKAFEYAVAHGYNVNVAVVDTSGTLMAFVRMNDAPLHSIEISIDKAYTSVSFKIPTSAWKDEFKNHSKAVGDGLTNRPRFVGFGGGIPIIQAGEVIGAIGVSGATEEQDERIALAGFQALIV